MNRFIWNAPIFVTSEVNGCQKWILLSAAQFAGKPTKFQSTYLGNHALITNARALTHKLTQSKYARRPVCSWCAIIVWFARHNHELHKINRQTQTAHNQNLFGATEPWHRQWHNHLKWVLIPAIQAIRWMQPPDVHCNVSEHSARVATSGRRI